jgi:hypothetical protein
LRVIVDTRAKALSNELVPISVFRFINQKPIVFQRDSLPKRGDIKNFDCSDCLNRCVEV